MKIVKKVLSVIIAMSMLFGTVTFAATYKDVAQDKNYYSAVSLLSAIEIIKGYEDGTFGPDKNVTRAEFSVMLVRTLGLSGVGNSDPAGLTFKDLGTVAWAVSDIRTAYDLGIINGMSAAEFAPDSQVTYEQAIKMIVCALGYKVVALDKVGGDENLVYPDGYLAVATQNDIDLGVSVKKGQPAKRFEIAKLLFNSLEVDLMEKSLAVGSDQYVIRKGKTILSDKLRIRIGTGELKADENTSVSTTGQLSKKGEVSIYQQDTSSEDTFLKGTVATDGVVGHSIKYYYREDNNGIKTLVYLDDKTKNSSILKIDANNIETLTGTIENGIDITYWVNKDTDRNTTSVSLPKGCSVVTNGRMISSTTTPIEKPLSGQVELMSTDSNGTYDKIFITSYETYVVKTVSTTDKKVIDMYRSSEKSEIVLDEGDSQNTLKMTNTSNSAVALTSLAKWNVLTVKRTNSSSKNTIDVVVAAKPITGSITELDKDNLKLKISGTAYEFSKYFKKYYPSASFDSLTIDDSGTFYLDKDGRIAAFDKAASRANNYGYIAAASYESDVLNFKILLQDATTTGAITVKGANRIKLYKTDGGAAETDKAKIANEFSAQQLVKYSKNGAGEIDAISIKPTDLVKGLSLTASSYNTPTREFITGSSRFMVDSNTKIFIVPNTKSDYDNYTTIPIGELKGKVTNDATAYDLTGEGTANTIKTAKAVILYGEDPRNVITEESPIAIITAISSITNSIGVAAKRITAYTYGVGKTGASETFVTESASTLDGYDIGDVIMFGISKKLIKDGSVKSILDVHAKVAGTLDSNFDTNVIKVNSGRLYSVTPATDKIQTFYIANTALTEDCDKETTIRSNITTTNDTVYFTYPKVQPNDDEPTKSDLINMANTNYYTKETPAKAAQVFVFTSKNAVKVVYYYSQD